MKQRIQSFSKKESEIKPISTHIRPQVNDYRFIPLPKRREKRNAPIIKSMMGLGMSLIFWNVLVFISGRELTFFSIICGVAGGYLYGKNCPVKTNGIGISVVVFLFCCLGLIASSVIVLSKELDISIRGIVAHFGFLSLIESSFEKTVFTDWLFLAIGVVLSWITATRTNRHFRLKI